MKFEEALSLLRNGKKIRLPVWGQNTYLYIFENQELFIHYGAVGNSDEPYIESSIALLSDKWIEYDPTVNIKEINPAETFIYEGKKYLKCKDDDWCVKQLNLMNGRRTNYSIAISLDTGALHYFNQERLDRI